MHLSDLLLSLYTGMVWLEGPAVTISCSFDKQLRESISQKIEGLSAKLPIPGGHS